jgi:hypothetical protein
MKIITIVFILSCSQLWGQNSFSEFKKVPLEDFLTILNKDSFDLKDSCIILKVQFESTLVAKLYRKSVIVVKSEDNSLNKNNFYKHCNYSIYNNDKLTMIDLILMDGPEKPKYIDSDYYNNNKIFKEFNIGDKVAVFGTFVYYPHYSNNSSKKIIVLRKFIIDKIIKIK